MMLLKLLNIGVRTDNQAYINQRIIITNFITLFFAGLSIPFLFVIYLYFPQLFTLSLIFTLVCVIIPILNGINLHILARFITATCLTSIVTLSACYLQPANKPLMSHIFIIQMIFWAVPWLVFHFKEKILLVSTLIYTLTSTLSFPYIAHLFEMEVNEVMLSNDIFPIMCYVSTALASAGGMFFFSYLNEQAENNAKKLITEIEEKNTTLKEKENTLTEYIQKIEQNREEDKKREWVNTGLAEFGELMRLNNDDSKTFSDRIIAALIEYLHANQGGIFIANKKNENETILELSGCYAYNRKKYIKKQILIRQFAEGLIGQAFLEKETIYLKEIPEDYLRITSGLGDAPPRYVLIVPLKFNERIEGVVEIAALKEFEDYQIQFVEKVAEGIASSIVSVKTNQQTRKLLEETQQQAEQLKAQEEEMRQNNEELATTQEEMKRRTDELEKLLEIAKEKDLIMEESVVHH